MGQKTTWILVCDASRARVFEETARGRVYPLVASFDHPAGRARVRDLVADAQGRKPVGGSQGVNARPGGFHGRPGVEPVTDAKEVEVKKFTRDLASMLEKGLVDHAYERLVLVAPPRLLGALREELSEQVLRRVESTLDKDLAPLDDHELKRRLRAEREQAGG